LLDGRQIDAPRATGSNVTYKQAPRARLKVAEQHDVFDQGGE
jgi:hypothetical protein